MVRGNIIDNTGDDIIDYWDDYVSRSHLEDTENKMKSRREEERRKREERRATPSYETGASDALQTYALINVMTPSPIASSHSCSSSSSSSSNTSYSSSSFDSGSSSCD